MALSPREVYFVRPSRDLKRRQPETRWVPKQRPLFTRLVFANVAQAAHWAEIARCPLVYGVLAMDGRPYRLSEVDVKMLYNIDGIQCSAPQEPKPVVPGKKARVATGALAGHYGDVQAIAERRAKLLMEILGSKRVIDLPLTSLEAA